MMNVTKWLTILLVLSLKLAVAGDHKGGGGNSVDCGKESYFYDFFVNPGKYPQSNLKDFEIVDQVLDQMSLVDSTRAELYRQRADDFLSLSVMVTDANLGVIRDTGLSIQLPIQCRVVQTIIQKRAVFTGDKRFLISAPQWNKLSHFDRAGLIIHELLYWELDSLDSRLLGQFNAYLFQNLDIGYKRNEYFLNLKNTGFKSVYLHGIPMDASRLTLSGGVLSSDETYPGLEIEIAGILVKSVRKKVELYANGVPKFVSFKGALRFSYGDLDFSSCLYGTSGCEFSFSEDGTKKILWMDVDNKLTSQRKYQKVTILESGKILTEGF